MPVNGFIFYKWPCLYETYRNQANLARQQKLNGCSGLELTYCILQFAMNLRELVIRKNFKKKQNCDTKNLQEKENIIVNVKNVTKS